jgi:hypothetical protein
VNAFKLIRFRNAGFWLQVRGNGFTTISKNGLVVSGGGITAPGGITMAGSVSASGNVVLVAGPVSVTSGASTAATLDVYAQTPGFAGNAILGRIPSGSTGDLASLYEGGNLLFNVCVTLGLRDCCTALSHLLVGRVVY